MRVEERHADDVVGGMRASVSEARLCIRNGHMFEDISEDHKVEPSVSVIDNIAVKDEAVFRFEAVRTDVRFEDFAGTHKEIISEQVGPFAIAGPDI